jgi:hypothetical protein
MSSDENKKYEIQARVTNSSAVQQPYPPFREKKFIERNKTTQQLLGRVRRFQEDRKQRGIGTNQLRANQIKEKVNPSIT